MIEVEQAPKFKGMNYVDGVFVDHRQDFHSLNPATEEILGYFPKTKVLEVDKAVTIAKKAFIQWRLLSRVQRAEYFDRLCQLLKDKVHIIAEVISLETGKTVNESKAEVIEALHMAQYCFSKGRAACGEVVASELNERDSYVLRKPKGVVAVVAPWNFPFAIGGFWTAGPALLEGNTVVFKPSEETSWVGQLIAELYQEAGFPAGVFNLIHGDGETGDTLVRHPQVDHICFTGSAEVGMHIRKVCAESWHKTCSCELGSKSAVIVMDDADLDLALSACVASAFKLSGQRCVSSGRILIHQNLYDKFSARFVELASKIIVGDPFAENTLYGPLINETQRARVESFNELTYLHPTTKVLLQGKRLHDKGYFLSPHVYQTEWNEKPYLKQEVFGPHVALVPFRDLEQAIHIYNDTDYGLALGVITNDYRKMREIRQRCDSGMIYFNLGSIGAESHLPFTGLKRSGNGSSAAGTFDAVVHKVSVTVNHGETMNFPQGLQ
jgi:aldehyde dehydrogenase (NAD+)